MTVLADQIIELYERHARHWDAARRREPLVEAIWLDRFCSFMPPAACVLDLGCGGGVPIAKYFLEHGFNVTGIDTSETMISLCRDRFSQGQWLLEDMRTLSLGRTFGGLIAWDSFFHLKHEDQRRMFPVFRQHAAPGASLLFTSGPEHGEVTGSYQGEPLYHASLAEVEYRSLLSENGFSVAAHAARDAACGQRTVWLAHLRAEPACGPRI
jgi:SAM-dependent methyltransferase